jgi:threonylcarbamoyladenosine tRNA methylthiotransferase CDKAL1
MGKIFTSVYGCPSNIADCEIALGLLKESGFEIVDSPQTSDANIIFTCIVKTPTEQRMIGLIKELTETNKPLIVAGCMPKTSQRTIEKINPNATLVGPDSIGHIVDAVRAALERKRVIFVGDERKIKPGLPRIRKNKDVGIVPISIGCLSSCSYCAVKFARGKLKSYPADKIVQDVEKLVNDGCTEIWLTSQDNGCYGADIGANLAGLLKAVCWIDGNFKVRVGMMNPTHTQNFLDDLIDAYKNDKIMKFLHLPVQTGSDRVLKLMKRGYTVDDFEKIVSSFVKEIPDLFLCTDIIVGFPGETQLDFEKTLQLIEKTRPQKVNISKFGVRSGTEAAKMKQIDVKIINERSKKLHTIISQYPVDAS